MKTRDKIMRLAAGLKADVIGWLWTIPTGTTEYHIALDRGARIEKEVEEFLAAVREMNVANQTRLRALEEINAPNSRANFRADARKYDPIPADGICL